MYGKVKGNSNLSRLLYAKYYHNQRLFLASGVRYFQRRTNDCGSTRCIRKPDVQENLLDNIDKHSGLSISQDMLFKTLCFAYDFIENSLLARAIIVSCTAREDT